jgi:hypothetical protein
VNPSPLQKRTSCNTFASLVREPGTSTNQINKDTSTHTFMFGCCIRLEQQCFMFNDKSSSTFKLVVASVTNEFSKGLTIGSPTKQCPVLNDNPAIECSLQLQVPMIRASIRQ